ncbi:MAG: O-antigen ligase family protein [Coriobacteriia bacterium]|nr:O-antigen ligase family protein [Coriobacteriia bacterium]
MNGHAQRLPREALPWAGACLAAGLAAGVLAGQEHLVAGLGAPARWAALAALVAAILYRPRLGLWVMLVAAPLNDYGRIVTGPVPVTVFQAALGASLVAWGWLLLAGEVRLHRPNRLQLALVLPFLAALWSLPLSLDPSRTAYGAARLLFLWLFALIVSYSAEDPRRRERIVEVFVWTGVALAVVSFAQYAFPGLPVGNTHLQYDAAGVDVLTRPAAFFLDPNFLAGYLAVASLVSLVRVVHSSSRREAALWAVPTVLCATAMALTLSRSGLVGFLAGAVAVVLTAPPRRRRAMLVAALLLAVLAVPVIPERYVQRVTALGDVMSEGSLATRFFMVGSTLEIIRDFWGTGTGLAAFDVAYPSYRRIGALPRILRPHEVPLALPAEMGVAGLIAEVALLAAVLWAFAAARRRGWRVTDAVVLTGVLTLLVQSWFQYYLYFEYLWLFAALAAALPAPDAQRGAGRA